jgi:hypothetical protein
VRPVSADKATTRAANSGDATMSSTVNCMALPISPSA